MTVFLGTFGRILLSRKSTEIFNSTVKSADVNTTLNRFGFDGSIENILTGDRLAISTTNPQDLLTFLAASAWPDGVRRRLIVAYANVNALGGIRLFPSFEAAVNNNRAEEKQVTAFNGEIPILVQLYGSTKRILGDVTGFSLNTSREAIESTTLSDKFKRMYTAGLISGSGSIDCLFNPESNDDMENSLLLLQLINRTDLGNEFKCFLQLTEPNANPGLNTVSYVFEACITNAGVEVQADQAITCSFDFVTTGELQLVIGKPRGFELGNLNLEEDTDDPAEISALLAEVSD